MAQTHLTAVRGGTQTMRIAASAPTADPDPVEGDLYYDTSSEKIGRYDGTKWVYGVAFTSTSTSTTSTSTTTTP